MANALYDPGREGFLGKEIGWNVDDVRTLLVKSTYVFSSAHRFVSDLGAVINGRTAALTGKTITNGIADADDISLVATDAVPCNALIAFKHTGDDATARLIGYIDTVESGLPLTPAAGGTINIAWDNGADKIFKL